MHSQVNGGRLRWLASIQRALHGVAVLGIMCLAMDATPAAAAGPEPTREGARSETVDSRGTKGCTAGSATDCARISAPETRAPAVAPAAVVRTIEIVSGNSQFEDPNTPLRDPLVVRVLDDGNPAPGVTINWAVTVAGSATVASATTTSDASGLSSNTVVLGPDVGPVQITATRADDTGQSVGFVVFAENTTMFIVSGDNQVGVVGADGVQPLVVSVHQNEGIAPSIAGKTVNWQVMSGDAVLATASSVSDSNSQAQMTFSYGPNPGPIVIRATSGSATTDFHLTSAPYQLTITGGDGQSANAGQPLPEPFAVQVDFPAGMTLPQEPTIAHRHAAPSLANVPLQWAVLAGGGSLAQGATTSTDASGKSSNGYTLGSAAGTNQIQVTAPGGTKVTFTAESVAATGQTLAIVSGDNQSGAPNSTLPAPLVVEVTSNGSPTAGMTLQWQVTSGTATLASANSVTGADGRSSNTLTLGNTLGPVEVTVSFLDELAPNHPHASTNSVVFHATIVNSSLHIVSGDNQLGVVGADAAQPLVVRLEDSNGNPVVGKTVAWQVTSGPAALATASSTTDAAGNAQASFAYSASTGPVVIRASADDSSVDFHATSASYQITITGGNNQTAAPGQPLPQDFTVQLAFPAGMTTLARNSSAHPHAAASLVGVPVQWSVIAGGGTLSEDTLTETDGGGRTSNHYTLGSDPGVHQIKVVVPGGNSVTFTANSATSTQAVLKIVSGDGQALAPNTASQPLVVELTDNGVPLAGVTVSWSADNATLASATSVTDSNGRASNTARVTRVGAATVDAVSNSPATNSVSFGLNGGLSFLSGLSPQQRQLGHALDNGCTALAAMGSLTPAQQDLLNQCNALAGAAGQSPGQAVDAIDQLFSNTAYLETSAAILISTAQFDNIKARIAALRSGTGGDRFGGLAFSSPSGSLPVGSLGLAALDAASGKDNAEAGAGFDRWGFFVGGTFSHGSSDPRQSLPGYGFNTRGITAGIDYRFSDHFIVGVGAGFAKYKASLDAHIGGMDTNAWTLSAYTTMFRKDDWYVDGVFSWGSNSYDLTRKITYTLTGPGGTTTVNQIASGRDDGNTLAAALTIGRDFSKGPWSFGPYFRGTWMRVNYDGYQEVLQAGPGSGLGMAVQTHPLKSTATVLGAKLNYASSQSWGVFMPHAEVEWQHEFQDNPDTVTAYFLQDPTHTPITVSGFPVDSNFFRLGLGASFVFPQGRSGFIYYEKTLGRAGISQDGIALGLRIEF